MKKAKMYPRTRDHQTVYLKQVVEPFPKNGHKKALKNGMKHSRSGFCGN